MPARYEHYRGQRDVLSTVDAGIHESVRTAKRFSRYLVCVLLCLFLSVEAFAEQLGFSQAEDAAEALYQAILKKDDKAVTELLGAKYAYLLPLNELDEADIQRFIFGWKKKHELEIVETGLRVIHVGQAGWTFPIPLLQVQGKWRFDGATGAENIRTRRIGRNELAAMQAVLAYFDAQTEYAENDRDGDGVLEYAQKIISSPGKRDGLYWETAPGETLSPLGTLMANRKAGEGYHGYFYRILTAQGKHAEGGAYDYLIDGRMRSGFALIAWPVEYGDSGVMSFMISHTGTLYEKDLGADTEAIAENMQVFDPNESWVSSELKP